MKSVDPVAALKSYRAEFKTQRDAAAKLGISDVYMSDLLNGRRDLPEWILDELGLQRILVKPRQKRKAAK